MANALNDAVKAAAALNAAGFDVAAAVEMLLNRRQVEANRPLIFCFGAPDVSWQGTPSQKFPPITRQGR